MINYVRIKRAKTDKKSSETGQKQEKAEEEKFARDDVQLATESLNHANTGAAVDYMLTQKSVMSQRSYQL